MDQNFFHITHIRVGMNHAGLCSLFASSPFSGPATLQLNFVRINALVCTLYCKPATCRYLHPVIIPDLTCRVYQTCSLLYLFQLGEDVLLVVDSLGAGPVLFPECSAFYEPRMG